MISNERQYRITKAEAERFRQALAVMDAQQGVRDDIHPRLVQAERDALQSQLDDLLGEMAEYEALRAGGVSIITVESFDQLAEGLIKARIASRLSQKALAERLGLKEQQIQRYEAERYASASFQRLQEIAAAIGVTIREEILLPLVPTDFKSLKKKAAQAGIDEDFLMGRLLPSADAAVADGTASREDDSTITARAISILSRVFGWTQEVLLGAEPLGMPRVAAAEGRFKMPAHRDQREAALFASYAHYLAMVVARACVDLPKGSIPTDAAAFRHAYFASYSDLTLPSVLRFAWDLGVAVVPLKGQGTFHGACWRHEGRNIIVLKQTSAHTSRWVFDLLHEIFHAGQHPELPSLSVVEADETSDERRNSGEEIAATQFAGDVVLNGRAEELAEACVRAARGSVERLKSVLPGIARQHTVSVTALANYMAFRLSWQGINWWGTASNLQKDNADPWAMTRDIFLERFPFGVKSAVDRQLLERALR
jgi:transcriptional regulator with XRE-family HTH domain/Zn-dependent peptidase ImmA (M78 family)